MRRLIVLFLLTIATTGVLAAWEILPEPPVVRAVAFTPEQITTQFQIERAEAQALAVYARNHVTTEFAEDTAKAAVERRMDAGIVAAIVVIESHANPKLCTRDCGLMQINRRIWRYPKNELLDPRRNLQIGTTILAGYIHQFGLIEGLHHYNGLGSKTCPTDRMMYASMILRTRGHRV